MDIEFNYKIINLFIWVMTQPGYGYQQQLVPGMRPGGGHGPNYFMPMVQPHQQRPGGGGRRPGGIQQFQQQPPMMQHQVLSLHLQWNFAHVSLLIQ